MDPVLDVLSPVVIDPRGDLHLIVHGPPDQYESETKGRSKTGSLSDGCNAYTDKRTFLVCSRALARASPVFERMLYGHFAEAQKSNPWMVELHDDEVNSMNILLRIMHGDQRQVQGIFKYKDDSKYNFDQTRIWIKDIYDLAVLTDKYQMTKLFWGWSGGLVYRMRACLNQYTECWEYGPDDTLPRLLWICFELGATKLARTILKFMVAWTVVDDHGVLLYCNAYSKKLQPWFAYTLEPGDLSDFIRDERMKALKAIPEKIGAHLCATCWSESCQKLQQEGSWPIDSGRFEACVYSIFQDFKSIQGEFWDDDDCVCRDLNEISIADVKKFPKIMSDHLESQAKESGFVLETQDEREYVEARKRVLG
ncbi:hypothetical protein F5Y18DRAFT_423137 [Xylariaceae sp. FL1019]|nr:hypothetical protein F5Y18DRAFT_423137 [Xylariaceae sp. FL1019]